MAKLVSKVVGIVLLLVGIVGFFLPSILGLHLTLIHNIVHLATSVVAIYFGFAGSTKAAHSFCQVFGVVYLLVGLLGFIAPTVVVSLLMGHNMTATETPIMDNIVHLLLGVVFMVVGLLREPQQVATT
jgi:preprotein translocase subunit Sss1